MNELMKKTTLYSMGFFVLSMCAIVYFSMTKTIEISNTAQDEIAKVSDSEYVDDNVSEDAVIKDDLDTSNDIKPNELKFDKDKSNTDYLCIPLPLKTESTDISIENHYMDHKLFIVINTEDTSFYKETCLTGNRDLISEGTYEAKDNKIKICFLMDGLYEYKTVLENGSLYISFFKPREMFDRIVVIDPSCGGGDEGYKVDELLEKNISLSVARELKSLFDESDIKVYYTRMDDVNPSLESRVALANDTKADMYVRIEADFNDDASVYGVTSYYNGDYFIPGFGNVELADLIEKEVVTMVKGKALGLKDASMDDYTLIYSMVPSTTVKVGCMSNKQEAILLGREDYVKKIAQGIYNGIMKGYE